MTPEEQLIQRYFDAFNRHDIEGVVACFHDEVAGRSQWQAAGGHRGGAAFIRDGVRALS
jgi:hypothetical protein